MVRFCNTLLLVLLLLALPLQATLAQEEEEPTAVVTVAVTEETPVPVTPEVTPIATPVPPPPADGAPGLDIVYTPWMWLVLAVIVLLSVLLAIALGIIVYAAKLLRDTLPPTIAEQLFSQQNRASARDLVQATTEHIAGTIPGEVDDALLAFIREQVYKVIDEVFPDEGGDDEPPDDFSTQPASRPLG